MAWLRSSVVVALTALSVQILPSILQTRLPLHFGGETASEKWEPVQNAFKENFYAGWEHEGAAVAVYHKGKLVVDIWGGYADQSSCRKWNQNTITMVYSTTKAVAALCVAILVDRGHLSYDSLVTNYWPEFGKNGKDNITVAMLMNHQAGLVYFDRAVEKEDVWDHERMAELIEDQRPNWPPGQATGYHALTFGWLVDQLVRKTDPKHRSVGHFFREEVALPNDIDFYIGLPMDQEFRVARQSADGLGAVISSAFSDYRFAKMLVALLANYGPDSFISKITANVPWLGDGSRIVFNDPETHAMEIASANGIGSARALAKMFDLVVQRKLLSQKTLNKLLEPQLVEHDLVLNMPDIPKGFGFLYSKRPATASQDGWLIGHPGNGGQNVQFDLDNKLAYSYVTNGIKPGMDDLVRTFARIKKSVYDVLAEQ